MAGPAPRPQTRAEEYGLVSSMIDVSDPDSMQGPSSAASIVRRAMSCPTTPGPQAVWRGRGEGQAARSYSWTIPPRTSRRWTVPRCCGPDLGSGTSRWRPRWGRARL